MAPHAVHDSSDGIPERGRSLQRRFDNITRTPSISGGPVQGSPTGNSVRVTEGPLSRRISSTSPHPSGSVNPGPSQPNGSNRSRWPRAIARSRSSSSSSSTGVVNGGLAGLTAGMGASRRSTGTLNRGDEAPRDSSDSGYDGEVDIGGGTGVRRPNAQANGANGSRLSPGQRAG